MSNYFDDYWKVHPHKWKDCKSPSLFERKSLPKQPQFLHSRPEQKLGWKAGDLCWYQEISWDYRSFTSFQSMWKSKVFSGMTLEDCNPSSNYVLILETSNLKTVMKKPSELFTSIDGINDYNIEHPPSLPEDF